MKYLKPALTWLASAAALVIAFSYREELLPLLSENPKTTLVSVGALLASLVFALLRQVNSKETAPDLFTETQLLNLPRNKCRYSDRMAYLLAEMSQLAYYEIEREHDPFTEFAEEVRAYDPSISQPLDSILATYRSLVDGVPTANPLDNTKEALQKVLDKANCTLHPGYLDKGSAQGFVCYSNDPDDPFIVVAFRGTEKRVEDWLTDARANPHRDLQAQTGCKVHGGFYDSFSKLHTQLEAILEDIKTNQLNNPEVPVLFTGHSLGGALATIATRELLPDGPGACYSFGAPQVADYSYFQFVKTPVYRVVNSSDIVPRVPPGAWTTLLLKLMGLLRYLCIRVPGVAELIEQLERLLMPLKDYRHFGDLRYLTDIKTGQFDEVELLRNPNYLDVVQWFWRHLAISYGLPVKSHSLGLYRHKLREVGKKRLERVKLAKKMEHFV